MSSNPDTTDHAIEEKHIAPAIPQQKVAAEARYREEYPESNPESIREPAGRKASSRAGIERDGEIKEMPGAVLDIELRMASHIDSAQDPKKAFGIVKSAILRFQGALLYLIPTPKGYLRCQCIFPNKTQAHNAAVYIHQNADNDPEHNAPIKKAKFGLAVDEIKLATYNGHLFAFGNGPRMAFKLQNANPEMAEISVVATHEAGKPIVGNALREEAMEETKPLHSRETEKSKTHAKDAIRPPNPDLPQAASRIEIRFPQSIAQKPEEMLKIATRLIDEIAPHPMRKDEKYTPTHIHLIGQVLTICLPEERSPGNLGERIADLMDEILEQKLVIPLSHSKYSAVALDEDNHTFQGTLPPSANLGEELDLDGTTGSPGIYIDDYFKRAARHERNASIANFVTDEKASLTMPEQGPPISRRRPGERRLNAQNFYKVQKIEIAGEAIVKGRYTVGRENEIADLDQTLQKAKNEQTAQFTVINGEAGIGKTRHAVDAIHMAEEAGFCSVYYKTQENGKTASLTGIRKMTKSLLAKLGNEAREAFRDLQFFSLGTVPPGEADAYGKRVEALNQNQVLAADRIKELIFECAKKKPLQLILDDLQWFDELSINILKRVITEIPQETALHLALLGRSGEEPIPGDLLEAVSTRTDHNKTISLKRIGDEEQLKKAIREENPAIKAGELADQVAQKRFTLTRDYIYANLPEEYADARVADGFIWKILEISEGLPIVISETISFLLEEGKISLNQKNIVTPTDKDLDQMKKDTATETLSTIIQAKFDRLSEDEKQIVDYLVVLVEIDLRLLTGLLKHLRLSEKRISAAIESLKQKGLIKTKPVSFTHDLIENQRKIHLKDRGSLSRKAAACYIPLTKNRSRFANFISPGQIFRLLEIALEDPNECPADVRTKLREDHVPLGLEAADHNLQTQNQYRALQIVESLEKRLTAEFNTAADPQKQSLASNLAEIHLRAAEAHLRLGHKVEPEKSLEKYARLSENCPQAQLMQGEQGFRYQTLRLKAAFAQRSREKLQAALESLEAAPEIIALRITVSEARVIQETEGLSPHVMVAYGELIVANLRLAGARQSRDALDAVLPETENVIRMLKTKETSNRVKALRIDIERTVAINEAYIFRKEICDNVEEALYIKQFTAAQKAGAQELEQRLTGILQTYLTDTQLVRDPQTLGFLYEKLAEMQIIQGNREEARRTVERGLRLSHNWGIPEAVSALSMLAGDERTTQEIAKLDTETPEAISCAHNLDENILREALDYYAQGVLVMERMGATQAAYMQMNAINRTFCMALCTFTILAKNPEFDTAKSNQAMTMRIPTNEKVAQMEKLKTEIAEALRNMTKILLELKVSQNPTYSQELCTFGLLLKAAQRIGIEQAQIPDFIKMEEIYAEYGHQNSIRTKPYKPLSEADIKYLKLRKEGIVALMPGGLDPEIPLDRLEELL